MAKPTKYAPVICTSLSILAVIGIILSLVLYSPLPITILLLPVVAYEIYRTEGASTKTSSIIIGVILVLELILIIFNIDFDLAKILDQETKYIAGYELPLGSLTIIGPSIIAILSIILFIRTYGVYTKWLAVIIFISCFIIIYTLNPDALRELFKMGINELLDRFSYM